MKKFFKFGCLGVIALVILGIIGAIASSGGNDNASTNTNKETTASKPAETSKPAESTKKEEKPAAKEGVLTKEKFEQIKDGMTYEEVVKVVGAEGKLLSESGEKGTQFHTVMYEFETDGFMSSASMMFQGGKLINKAQFGLGGGSGVEISIDQFNKIQNGMTLEEVIAIVGGEGEIISESGEKGTQFHTIMYSYPGKGSIGANVSLMFQGNKLQNKSQFGLE
ncbi:DUF3862 domain-containing protein [Bacillus sp. FJAT-29953]|nr:DUF3862 domain-containing protein [Bacillus sp. FJAT-29953]